METLRETSISTLAEAKRRHVAQLNIQTRKNKIRRINRILNRIGCGGDADRLKSYQCVVTKETILQEIRTIQKEGKFEGSEAKGICRIN